MKHIKMKVCLSLSLLLLSLPSQAHTMGEREFVCPIGGQKFTQMMDSSGTSFGMQLDLKPLGPTPAPWRLPVCPENHFVFYKDSDFYTSEEIKRLEPFINSPTYQNLAKDNSAYFLLGKIEEFEKFPDENIGWAYLQASWEAKDAEQYQVYAAESLKFYQKTEALTKIDNRQLITNKLIIGELHRRLGQFAQAENHFKKLQSMPQFQSDDEVREIIAYQLKLIAKKDTEPHAVPSKK